ncbi:MAG: PAS domain-containing protein [Alphaproteobacteria bacterium]|nr:PAS domain-containing protein [Alphaproteobacteria bacterium]
MSEAATRRVARLWRAESDAADALRRAGFEMDRGAAWPVALTIAALNASPSDLTGDETGAPGDRVAPDIAAIAKSVGLPRTTVRRALERLEERGLVSLRASSEDGRQRLIEPTPRFAALMEEVSEAVETSYRSRLAPGAAPDQAITQPVASEPFAQALLERLEDAALLTDAPGPGEQPRILAVNCAFERLTGYQRDEILGRTPKMLQGPDTNQTVRAKLRRAIDARRPAEGVFLNYRKDGSPYLCDLTLEPLQSDPRLDRPDCILGVARDVGGA